MGWHLLEELREEGADEVEVHIEVKAEAPAPGLGGHLQGGAAREDLVSSA